VALATILFKAITLTRKRNLPERLAGDVERLGTHFDGATLANLQREFAEGESTLARLGAVAMRNSERTPPEAQEAVQSSAREEIVRMQTGLPILEVVITIAPLLGLLGTASGLVVIFGSAEDLTSGVNNAKLAAGIARALGTTIAGIVVAVPSVVAHSFFTRKIERIAARLEVLLGRVVSVCRAPAGVRPTLGRAEAERMAQPQFSQLPQ
jgi:biopolymer transport protein ExbB